MEELPDEVKTVSGWIMREAPLKVAETLQVPVTLLRSILSGINILADSVEDEDEVDILEEFEKFIDPFTPVDVPRIEPPVRRRGIL